MKIPKNVPKKNLIKGAIRRLFSRSPLCREILASAVHKTKKGPRGGKQYVCACCKAAFPATQVQVDHIVPVMRHDETIQDLDYNTVVMRIFCDEENLQVLCKECHRHKTTRERKRKTTWNRTQKKILKDSNKMKAKKRNNASP